LLENITEQNWNIARRRSCYKNNYNGYGYFYNSAPKTNGEASAFCQKYQSHLPRFNVKTLLDRSKIVEIVNAPNTRFWLDMTKYTSGWKWHAPSGEVVDNATVGWNTGEPNNKDPTGEHCVHTNYEMQRVQKLNDVSCSNVEAFICETKCPSNTQAGKNRIDRIKDESCKNRNINNYGYYYDDYLRTHEEAAEFCKVFSGHLPYVNADTTQKRAEIVKKLGNSEIQRYWVGMSSNDGNTWVWGDKITQLQEVNNATVGWLEGEPHNNGGNETCVHANYHLNGTQLLNSFDCSKFEPTVCEIKCA